MRKTNTVGSPMLVKLPEIGDIWENTGEGGLAFFFVIHQKNYEERRQVCIAGDILWPRMDVQLKPRPYAKYSEIDSNLNAITIDGGLLIGSTGLSLWSKNRQEYFTASFDDLNPDGKQLYHFLKKLYGKVDIVTLLDT